jgi:CO dehydrogenase maturation factor
VDADPDANLASALGIPSAEASKIIPISAQRELIKERTGANPKEFGQLFKLNPIVDDIPDGLSLSFRGIKLLVMGAVRKGGQGCACPENVLLRSLLSELLLNRDEAVVVDMEAGIEHLGRSTAKAIDTMVVVVEPGERSVATAKTIFRLGEEIGLHSFAVVGNKIRNEAQRDWIVSRFPPGLIIGLVPYSEIISEADLHTQPLIDLLDEPLRLQFQSITRALIDRAG